MFGVDQSLWDEDPYTPYGMKLEVFPSVEWMFLDVDIGKRWLDWLVQLVTNLALFVVQQPHKDH
ncbi:hypothetical protein NECAME_08905 [Necator americanus]|uniref:Uncharacterized protein n=1 Tax=Necator americanus TaxID=51031 RepID=W2TG89_NECAM|nr:hypothetical protein NECAME_08905 [Necator americanus]ETN80828.1 hypothetical protein NECAME_08905 [Necator americanus]